MNLFNKPIIQVLLKQLREEELEPHEKNELETWLNADEQNKALADQLSQEQFLKMRMKEISKYSKEAALEKFWTKFQPEEKARILTIVNRKWWYVAATVAFILIIGAVVYNYQDRGKSQPEIVQVNDSGIIHDKAPGKDGAVLKLANGQTIVLDDAVDGNVAQQGNAQIIKQGGQLAYNPSKGENVEVVYNTLTTSRGRQFQLLLPDGSQIWLNAESSVTYPTSFVGNERKVEISGEAYFEVASDKEKPFKVLVNGMEVAVLGTHFNINAYAGEAAIKTTLLEGSVKIKSGVSYGQMTILKPGQQAQVTGNVLNVINNADVYNAVAWKNGLIVFNKADIKEIFREISRWYDVDIEFKSDIRVPKFYGEIPRNVNLSAVLKVIEINLKLQFTIEGNKITVVQPK